MDPHPLRQNGPGDWTFRAHAGQRRALQSTKRFVLVLAGTQSGKTVTGPPWLFSEIDRRGPGEYLVATPTYPLLEAKALPEFLRLFDTAFKLGRYTSSPSHRFVFHDGKTVVRFGHAGEPDSLEAATYKAAWLDEAGQRKFKVSSWEAVLRRLAVHQGRALLTTTPYYLGWLKQKLHDPWKAAQGNHPDVDVVRFSSTMNPAFPAAEYERARADLPGWKFRMFYDGQFEKPAGLVFDSFDASRHVVPRFRLPAEWPRFLGLDFGQVNTAAVFYAEEPRTGRLYAYREYHAGGRSAAEHAQALLAGEPSLPFACGGARSEGLWRLEFCAAGLPVHEPAIADLELGIDRVYAAHKRGLVVVFDDLVRYLDQLASYSRKVDDAGNVLAEIEDKHTYHLLDASRYILSTVFPGEAMSPGDQPTTVYRA